MELLTHDARRYAQEIAWRTQRPFLQLGPASWGWMQAALASIAVLARKGMVENVAHPVLILATSADKLVSHRAILATADRLPDCNLVVFGAQARHEILREEDATRNAALAAIDRFIARHLPASPAQTCILPPAQA